MGAMEKVVKVALERAKLMKTQAVTGIVNLVGRETSLAVMCASSVEHHSHRAAAGAEVEAAMLPWDETRVGRVLVEARVEARMIPVEAVERFLQPHESGRELGRQAVTHQAHLQSHGQRRCEQGLAQVCGTRCIRFQTSSLVRSLRRNHRAWWWTSTLR